MITIKKILLSFLERVTNYIIVILKPVLSVLIRIRIVEIKRNSTLFNGGKIHYYLISLIIKITKQEIMNLLHKDCEIKVDNINSLNANKYLYIMDQEVGHGRSRSFKTFKRLNILVDPINKTSEKIAASLNHVLNAKMVKSITKDIPADYIFFATPPVYRQIKDIPETSNWFYGDKAFFGRGQHFRFAMNQMQLNEMLNSNSDRFDRLGLKLAPQKKTGDKIMLCPQSETFHQLKGGAQSDWIKDTIAKLKVYSDREIIIRLKDQKNTEEAFEDSLKDIYCIIVMSSLAGVQAVMHGVPCIATDKASTSAMFGEVDLERINKVQFPENRYELLCNLANNQWTLNEMSSGKMLSDLRDYRRK